MLGRVRVADGAGEGSQYHCDSGRAREVIVNARQFLRTSIAFGSIVSCILLSRVGMSQSISGDWFTEGRRLDSGEYNKTILTIHQNQHKLTGTIATLGPPFSVRGKIQGDHFVLYAPWDENKPYLTGVILNRELKIEQGGQNYVARPATSKDYPLPVERIALPRLKSLKIAGVADRPPMGWNNWNVFENRFNDQIARQIADALVSSGMRDAGYVYVNIDDTWEGVRDQQGNLRSNAKFPDMKALADYIHSRGLKLGIYSSPGPRTCQGYVGSYGHEEQDAKTFAAWGVDYLKYDWCSASSIYKDDEARAVYQKMGQALQATGRKIVFSLCQYGSDHVWTWGADTGGQLWRTTGDIHDNWKNMMANIEGQKDAASFNGPGHWNDPDMLVVGNGHMTADEYRTHFGLWALASAPLIAGNDVRSMSDETKSILLNKEVIAVDQDPLGRQATEITDGSWERWVKPLYGGGIAVGIVNLSSTPAVASVSLSELPITGKVTEARDLWKHESVNFKNGLYSDKVPAHGILMLRVDVEKMETRTQLH